MTFEPVDIYSRLRCALAREPRSCPAPHVSRPTATHRMDISALRPLWRRDVAHAFLSPPLSRSLLWSSLAATLSSPPPRFIRRIIRQDPIQVNSPATRSSACCAARACAPPVVAPLASHLCPAVNCVRRTWAGPSTCFAFGAAVRTSLSSVGPRQNLSNMQENSRLEKRHPLASRRVSRPGYVLTCARRSAPQV